MKSKRIIFLVDMNAFYISCEATRYPEIKDKPAAVAGNPKNRTGIILTANYHARKYGVKTAMQVHQAKKLCPNLVLVPPDHAFYRQKSRQVMDILKKFSPVVQQNSVDEAWLDMTGSEGIFGEPAVSAKKIIDQIENELGLWCSIGISDNKFLSKMAADMKKPLGITELWKDDIKEKLWPLPINAMHGVGKKTAEKMKLLGINTIYDLAKFDKVKIVKELGKVGHQLYLNANGIDPSPVEPHAHEDVKSIGRSTTLPKNITKLEDAKLVILQLSEEVGFEARRQDKKGRTVQITIKYSDFTTITRQKSISPSYLTKTIYSVAMELLEENWNEKKPVRLLGISLTSFEEEEIFEQISIFELAKVDILQQEDEKAEKLEHTLDLIREKYGNEIISRGTLIE